MNEDYSDHELYGIYKAAYIPLARIVAPKLNSTDVEMFCEQRAAYMASKLCQVHTHAGLAAVKRVFGTVKGNDGDTHRFGEALFEEYDKVKHLPKPDLKVKLKPLKPEQVKAVTKPRTMEGGGLW